ASMFRTAELGTAGFVDGALLKPNQNSDKMLQERLVQGTISGASMATMHVLSNKLAPLTGANLAGATMIDKAITSAAAGVGGSITGFAMSGLLTDSATDLKSLATTAYQGAYTGALLGTLGSHTLKLHQPKSEMPALESFMAHENVQNDHHYLDSRRDVLSTFLNRGSDAQSRLS